ncbi:hypothetical protein ACM66B_003746 [Microbotryomycetes sp. NB124-2]
MSLEISAQTWYTSGQQFELDQSSALWPTTGQQAELSAQHLGQQTTDSTATTDTAAAAAAAPSAPPQQKPRKTKPPKPVPPGAIVTDKSCSHCRARKVKCNRVYPCDHCVQRREECDLKDWRPKPKKGPAIDSARVAELEARIAELEAVIATGAAGAAHAVPATPDFRNMSDSPESDKAIANIGAGSIDWRLATPQLAQQLSQHLVDAFSSSCCFLLPTYRWFQGVNNMSSIKSATALSPAGQVALAAFRAVGARTSPHSGLLGITINPEDQVTHPDAPLLSAGTRRQNACATFLRQAYAASFENDVAEQGTVESLAALLSLTQMSIFVELYPKKSRTSLRTAISQYKDLLDSDAADSEKIEIRRTFGFALYAADSLIAAFGKRAPMLTGEDLKAYFGHIGLVIPKLPDDKLKEVLDKMLVEARQPQKQGMLKTIRHLVHCWVCVVQRAFGQLAAPPVKSENIVSASVRVLWTAIDQIRAFIQSVLAFVSELDPNAFNVKAKHAHQHSHETDWVPQFVRLDRDLLDLQNMIHGLVKSSTGPLIEALRAESESRVRRGLKAFALYAKLYTCGAGKACPFSHTRLADSLTGFLTDGHMIFHQFFQLELLPDWTTLALQRFGSVPGPRTIEEELSSTELEWMIEGLQLDCFYTPDAQKRLTELSPRFVQIDSQTPQDFALSFFTRPSANGEGLNDPLEFDSLLTSFTTFEDPDALDVGSVWPSALGSTSSAGEQATTDWFGTF